MNGIERPRGVVQSLDVTVAGFQIAQALTVGLGPGQREQVVGQVDRDHLAAGADSLGGGERRGS
jgi:hypothetical protein